MRENECVLGGGKLSKRSPDVRERNAGPLNDDQTRITLSLHPGCGCASRRPRLVRLLKQLHPRVAVLSGCAILLVAGMAGMLAWTQTVPPRDELRLVRRQFQELVLENARDGAFKLT